MQNIVIYILIFVILLIQSIRLYNAFKKKEKVVKELVKRKKEINYFNFLTTSMIFNNEELGTILPQYLNRLRDELRWKYISFFRLDEKTQTIPIRFTGYLPKWYMEELSTKVLVKVGDAAAGRVISTKQPVIINVTRGDPRFENVQSYPVRAGYRSMSCYPVMGAVKTHGSCCIYDEHENSFTIHDTQFLSTCINLFGVFLENKLLLNYINQKNLK